jgi:hypothetical protein
VGGGRSAPTPDAAAKPSAHRASARSRTDQPSASSSPVPAWTTEVATSPSALTTTRSPVTSARIDGIGPSADGAANTCTPSPVPGSTASSPSPQNASTGAVRSGR